VPSSRARSAASVQQANVKPRVARAARVENAPKLDGTLDDPLWQSAVPISNFLEKEPTEGQPPTERTEVRILYTRHEVYFGIHCFDSEPGKIIASELRRDVSQDLDDHFEIMIDSHHDKRNGYVFSFNPLGTQLDGLITEEGANQNGSEFDPGWDGIWTSAARITKDGWTATIAIPFSTLNFTKSENVVWGLNFKRFIRRKNEEIMWAAWQRIYGIPKVSEAGDLVGITDIGSGRLFVVKPYVLGGGEQITGTNFHALHTGGLDIKYGLRSNLVLNATANTDFADTDVDQQQFNLTPFRISIPEKRPFFLENAGIFNFSTGGIDQLFFSRQIGIDPVTGEIVPVNFGAKLTGSLGRTQLGLMDVETRASGPNPGANYGIARVKESLFGDSYIGAMYIDKRSGSRHDAFNQSAGLDMRLVFFKKLAFYFWGAGTRSPGLTTNATDAGILLNYDSNWFHSFDVVDKIGPNYNPEVGFVPHIDVKEKLFDQRFSARPKIKYVRELNFEGLFYRAPSTRNVLQIEQWGEFNNIGFQNGSFIELDPVSGNIQRLNTPFDIYKHISFPDGIYRFVRRRAAYGSPQNWRLTFFALEEFGPFYTGHLNTLTLNATYRVNPRLSFTLGEVWNRFRLPVSNFSVDLASLQANYSFSRFLTLTTLVQANTSNTQSMSVNFRLRYNYRPDSDFYVIYNNGTLFQGLNGSNLQQVRDQRIAVKYTYSFQPQLGHGKNSSPATTDPQTPPPNSLRSETGCPSYVSPNPTQLMRTTACSW